MNSYSIPLIRPSVSAINIFAFLLLSFASCNHHSSKHVVYSHTLIHTDTLTYDSILVEQPTVFKFKNNSETEPVTFDFYNKNGINYHNAATMLSSIITKHLSDEQKAIAIWRLVATSGFSYSFDYDHHLQDNVNPKALITFPYFLCGEKAGIVTNLAILAGLPAHTVNLDGHVVAEIKYNGAWHIFDADENCIFRNQEGQIVSAENLHYHPDWIAETNMELAVKNNFFRFSRYQNYFKKYNSTSIDTSCIIHNYAFPNNDITLYPQDEVEFHLIPTSMWTRLSHPRYLFNTRGILKRKMNKANSNLHQIKDRAFSFNEEFPYYLTNLEVSSRTPIDVNVYFQYENRETLKTEKEFIGNLGNHTTLLKKFNAPSKPDIYYHYSIIFENLSESDRDKITVRHGFEFNSITFPMHRVGDKIITIDGTDQKNVSFQISNASYVRKFSLHKKLR